MSGTTVLHDSLTRAVVPSVFLAPRPIDHLFRHVYRDAFYVDGCDAVIVTIQVGTDTVRMSVQSTPYGSVWRHPNARARARLFDDVLRPLGLRRVGRDRNAHRSGWTWSYSIAPR